MAISNYVKCVNCGSQTLVETKDPEEKCQFCRKPARKKVDEEVVLDKTPETVAPEAESVSEKAENVSEKAENVSEAPAPEESSPSLYEGKPSTYQKGARKWGKICRECEASHTHEDTLHCSAKRCSRRCPPRLRPPFMKKPAEVKPKAQASRKSTKAGLDKPPAFKPVKTTLPWDFLPKFPEWDDGWLAEVRVEWLRAYTTLAQLATAHASEQRLSILVNATEDLLKKVEELTSPPKRKNIFNRLLHIR